MRQSDAGDQSRLERLVEWALGPDVLTGDDLPHAVTIVSDTVAAIVAAGVEPEVRALAEAAPALGGQGPATVLATGAGTSPWAAALVNGTAAVRLELDEGNAFCGNHPSAHTLPAVLATAQDVGADGRTFLAASTAAYEVAVRVGRGVRLRTAVHPFGTAMVCGAALGVARLRGLDVAQATGAVRLAAALAPASTQRAANQGATVRNAITGSCAAAGVLAVALAQTGTTDDELALPTVFGEILGEAYDDTWLDAGLGSERYLRSGYFKTHACSRWNHAPIEATESLLTQSGFTPDEVVDIEVATYNPATRLDGREPHTGFAGKHSIPFNVAARILLRDNGIDTYTDATVRDASLRSLMQRVRVVEDPAMTAAAPTVRAARVTIRLEDDRVVTATEEHPPGEADRPYPPEVIRAKHRALLGRGLGEAEAEAVLRWCDDLPRHRTLADLAPLLGGAR
ncbi:MAG TPA: MmgE/PrpD family protein [Lapillicoccus sp.]|nr:MmgE/PrpD family protein [Lapillicoccus sp.]